MNKEVIQWDYKGFKYGDFGGFEDATNELKKLGKQGWEATANITDGITTRNFWRVVNPV